MFGADIVVSHSAGLYDSCLKNSFYTGSEVVRRKFGLTACADFLFNEFFQRIRTCTAFFKNGISCPVLIFEKSEKNMFTADIGVSHILSGLDSQINGIVSLFCKTVEFIHNTYPFLYNVQCAVYNVQCIMHGYFLFFDN